MSLFNPDSKIMVALGKAADFMMLGFLWFICSLPVITIGASTTAFFFAAFKVLSEEAHIIKAFFRSFRQNFKQATLLWIVALVFLYLGVIGVMFYYKLDSPMRTTGLAIMILVMILYVFIMMYLFPYLSKFYCSFKMAFKNSLLLSIKHLPSTVLMIFLDVVVLVLSLYFTAMLMFLPSILCLLNSMILKRVFDKYIPKDSGDSDEGESFMTIDEIEAMDAALATEKAEMMKNVGQTDPSEETDNHEN